MCMSVNVSHGNQDLVNLHTRYECARHVETVRCEHIQDFT